MVATSYFTLIRNTSNFYPSKINAAYSSLLSTAYHGNGSCFMCYTNTQPIQQSQIIFYKALFSNSNSLLVQTTHKWQCLHTFQRTESACYFSNFFKSVIVLVWFVDICCYLDNHKISPVLMLWKDFKSKGSGTNRTLNTVFYHKHITYQTHIHAPVSLPLPTHIRKVNYQ